MKKPIRFFIYVGILGLTWFILSPALSINFSEVGAPIKGVQHNLSTFAITAITIALALLITYLITSGWGLIILGGLAFCGLLVLAILRPYLFPLIVPLAALWVACAVARRKESISKAKAQ